MNKSASNCVRFEGVSASASRRVRGVGSMASSSVAVAQGAAIGRRASSQRGDVQPALRHAGLPNDTPMPGEQAGDRDGLGSASAMRGRGPVKPRRPIPPKLYRIGELVDYSGLSRQTVHNYTTMGLLTESRWTEGGHRLWDESVFERLDTIAELKLQGRSMEYIREYFGRLDRT